MHYKPQLGLAAANAGVILFFFLSGFLMDRTFSRDPAPVPYLIRRSFRILPMYWISILVILLIEPHWTLHDAFFNALLAAPAAHVERMSGVYWTLYIEALFYALVPVVWALGARAIYASIFLLIALFSAMLIDHLPLSWAPFYIVYCFAGMQIGAWKRGAISSGALLVSLVAIVIGSSALPVVSPYLGLAPLVSATALIFALRATRPVPVLTLIGNVSFSWYLLHTTLGQPLMATLDLPAVLLHVISATATFAISIFSYWWIEQPMIEVGRGLIHRYRSATVRSEALEPGQQPE